MKCKRKRTGKGKKTFSVASQSQREARHELTVTRAAETVKLELRGGTRVASASTRDKQRRELGTKAVGCRAPAYIALKLLQIRKKKIGRRIRALVILERRNR
jgi:hypothetical protein